MEGKLDNLHSYLSRPTLCQLYCIGGIVGNTMVQHGEWYLYNRRINSLTIKYNIDNFSIYSNKIFDYFNNISDYSYIYLYSINSKIRYKIFINKWEYIILYMKYDVSSKKFDMLYFKTYIADELEAGSDTDDTDITQYQAYITSYGYVYEDAIKYDARWLIKINTVPIYIEKTIDYQDSFDEYLNVEILRCGILTEINDDIVTISHYLSKNKNKLVKYKKPLKFYKCSLNLASYSYILDKNMAIDKYTETYQICNPYKDFMGYIAANMNQQIISNHIEYTDLYIIFDYELYSSKAYLQY